MKVLLEFATEIVAGWRAMGSQGPIAQYDPKASTPPSEFSERLGDDGGGGRRDGFNPHRPSRTSPSRRQAPAKPTKPLPRKECAPDRKEPRRRSSLV